MNEPVLRLDDCQVLVVDDSSVARQVCECLLREIGLKRVTCVGRMSDARAAVERNRYDIVLCDYHFENEHGTGQDLLEDWRRTRALSFMAVFIMITGESKYQRVAEAIETALDDYLLKPFTANTLSERIVVAYRRKVALAPIYLAIERRDYARGIELCEAMLAVPGPYRLYAARLCVELYIKLGRIDDARRLLDEVCRSQALPWARLGLVALDIEDGDSQRARRVLESLVAEHPEFVDAYDVLARAMFEQGDIAGATATMRRAVDITPSNAARLQKLGWLAFLADDTAAAREALGTALRAGNRSRNFDWHSLVLLMFVLYDTGDLREMRRVREQWQRLFRSHAESVRLRRLDRTIETIHAFANRQFSAGVAQLRELAELLRRPEADFEFACDIAALIARVTTTEIVLPDAPRWIELIGFRFCATRSTTEALAALVRRHESHVRAIRGTHATIAKRCQDAMAHLVTGSPLKTVEQLYDCARRTLNSKPLSMARLVAARHRDSDEAVARLDAEIEKFQFRHCPPGPRIDLGLTTHTRKVVAGTVIDN
ncbi:tetratricopeptide repeat protein [Derxia gummosa]|uniref:Tetratricopeptide repeat protein n=1 Tax=Derxia gummosa DSM 723 TaxID=1121388 RepID=A0A8B6X952_9BURK|nr:tetratricopeptide repeat protein [Derxia gummosa]